VEYLLECHGWEGILKLLKEIETKTSTNDALDILDLNYESLEYSWGKWLKKKISNPAS